MKQIVLIERFESCPDMRISGSNIYTGMKAFYHVRGKNQGYKIYMTNNDKSLSFYIKLKGVNHYLYNDHDFSVGHPSRLINLTDWYFETE